MSEMRHLVQEVTNILNSQSEQPKLVRPILPGKWEFRDSRGSGETMNGGFAPHVVERKTGTTYADMNEKRFGGTRRTGLGILIQN
jgi:hypothetical protein